MGLPSLTTANEALSLVGKISDLVKTGMTIELKETVLELRSRLLELKEENIDLREKLANALKETGVRLAIVFEEPNYYLIEDDGTKSGPFCQTCYDKDKNLARLQTIEDGLWKCSVCKNPFETKEHISRRNSIKLQQRTRGARSRHDWMV